MRICCIVKPRALKHTTAIIASLEDRGVCVDERKIITYTVPLVHALYDHMDRDARDAITERLAGNPGVALLVKTESIECLLDIVGRHSDPAKCAPDSIRARFAQNATEERMGASLWWENALHRPVNEQEAQRDLALIFPEC